jgi:hypothetical protein
VGIEDWPPEPLKDKRHDRPESHTPDSDRIQPASRDPEAVRILHLVTKPREPITPFIDKVRALYTEKGGSTRLVMGGSGDYSSVADIRSFCEQRNKWELQGPGAQKGRSSTERVSPGRAQKNGRTAGGVDFCLQQGAPCAQSAFVGRYPHCRTPVGCRLFSRHAQNALVWSLINALMRSNIELAA